MLFAPFLNKGPAWSGARAFGFTLSGRPAILPGALAGKGEKARTNREKSLRGGGEPYVFILRTRDYGTMLKAGHRII